MMKFKAIATVIFSAVLMFCLTACKASPKSADKSSSQPVVAVSSNATTTSQTTTAVSFTTTATTTGTKRKTTTTTTVTTTAYAPITTTTSTATTTTVPEQTTTPVQTVATTTATTSAVTAATTTITTTTPIATTVAPVTTSNAATTTGPWDYLPEGNMNDTLWAYANLAMYGELTDEIKNIIINDIMCYAKEKYNVHLDEELYYNSEDDYHCAFSTGAKNNEHIPMTFEEIELYNSWGVDTSRYNNATLEQYARGFQQEAYNAVDFTYAEYGYENAGANVIFAYRGKDVNGTWSGNTDYNIYQVSFCV